LIGKEFVVLRLRPGIQKWDSRDSFLIATAKAQLSIRADATAQRAIFLILVSVHARDLFRHFAVAVRSMYHAYGPQRGSSGVINNAVRPNDHADRRLSRRRSGVVAICGAVHDNIDAPMDAAVNQFGLARLPQGTTERLQHWSTVRFL
jgi:hypothetical protein